MLSLSVLSIKDDYELITKMDSLNPDYLHLDIADGIFVPSFAEFLDIPTTLSKKDVHLMVSDIEGYIEKYLRIDPSFITFHIEATDNPSNVINVIKSKGVMAGIALNPETPVSSIIEYLGDIDLVLVMSVAPGYGEQAFIKNSIDKVKELATIRETLNYKYLIQIDGGINGETKNLVTDADILVVGSYITKSSNPEERLKIFK